MITATCLGVRSSCSGRSPQPAGAGFAMRVVAWQCVIDFFNLPIPAGRRNFKEADRIWSWAYNLYSIAEDGLRGYGTSRVQEISTPYNTDQQLMQKITTSVRSKLTIANLTACHSSEGGSRSAFRP